MVVIPCSKEKRWHEPPSSAAAQPPRSMDKSASAAAALGPLPACEAYTSPLHLAAQRYARATGRPWFILSALHGLLRPDDELPGDYDVTFSRPADPVIAMDVLAKQALRLGLTQASEVVSLCPADYNDRLRAALGRTDLVCPLDHIPLRELGAMAARITSLEP